MIFRIAAPHDTPKFYEETYFPQKFSPEWKKARSRLYGRYLDSILPYRELNRILDVGSGFGFFLAEAKNRGFEVFGIEPSKSASDYCQGQYQIPVAAADLAEARFPECSFDVVTFWNVLDHLEDPIITLREAYRVLRPGGAIFVRLPNAAFHLSARRFEILFQKTFGCRLDLSVIHRFAFGPGTIRTAFATAGFHNIRVNNSGLSWVNPNGKKDGRLWFQKTILKAVEFGCATVAALTAKRLLWAPSLFAWAEKPK